MVDNSTEVVSEDPSAAPKLDSSSRLKNLVMKALHVKRKSDFMGVPFEVAALSDKQDGAAPAPSTNGAGGAGRLTTTTASSPSEAKSPSPPPTSSGAAAGDWAAEDAPEPSVSISMRDDDDLESVLGVPAALQHADQEEEDWKTGTQALGMLALTWAVAISSFSLMIAVHFVTKQMLLL